MAKPKEEPKLFLKKYTSETNTYLYSLIIILPLILIYEAGVLLSQEYTWRKLNILANEIIVLLFEKIGLSNVTLIPAFLVMTTLFILQFRSDRKWEVKMSNLMLLHLEYLFYAALFFFAIVWIYPGKLDFHIPGSIIDVYQSIGAGIYEEFLFRLVLLSGLLYMFKKLLKVDDQRNLYVSIAVSAVCFAGFHHIIGENPFNWGEFLVRSAGGIYFGYLFLTRGYGVAAGAHAGYNLLALYLAS